MPLNEVCRERMFQGIEDPYLGKEITVRVVASGKGMPMYFSPDAFDPSLLLDSSEELFKFLSMRRGIMGVISGERMLNCPYTGQKMSPNALGGRHHATGGFSPSTPMEDKIEFARRIMMRNGVVPEYAPVAKTRIQVKALVDEEKPAPDKPLLNTSTDAAEKILREVTKGSSTTVTVPPLFPKSKSKSKSTKKG